MMIIIVKTFFSLSCLRSSICIPFTGRRAICMSDWVFCMRSKATSSTLSLFCKTNSDFFTSSSLVLRSRNYYYYNRTMSEESKKIFFFPRVHIFPSDRWHKKPNGGFCHSKPRGFFSSKINFLIFFVFSSFLSKVIQTRPTYFHLFFSRQKNNKKCFRKKLTEELNWTSACHSNFFWCKKEKKNFFQPATKKLQSKIISSE